METTPQALQLELMKLASFNAFDGPGVVADLQAHPDWWRGALMTRSDLIALRDLPEYWNVDTLYVTPVAGKEDELEALARTWEADEVSWEGGDAACRQLGSYGGDLAENARLILRVWWD